jgi:hypothetical protein
MANNTTAWTGDHCMDPETVPGILLTSHRLHRPAPTLQALGAVLVSELGSGGSAQTKEH